MIRKRARCSDTSIRPKGINSCRIPRKMTLHRPSSFSVCLTITTASAAARLTGPVVWIKTPFIRYSEEAGRKIQTGFHLSPLTWRQTATGTVLTMISWALNIMAMVICFSLMQVKQSMALTTIMASMASTTTVLQSKIHAPRLRNPLGQTARHEEYTKGVQQAWTPRQPLTPLFRHHGWRQSLLLKPSQKWLMTHGQPPKVFRHLSTTAGRLCILRMTISSYSIVLTAAKSGRTEMCSAQPASVLHQPSPE